MSEITYQEVAKWMEEEVRRERILYQEQAAWHIKDNFAEDFVYINVNGNLAIDKKVLAEFRKLTEKDIVWERGSFCWRFRESYDDPEKRGVE